MAKGRANPALTIWVYQLWESHPEIAKLRDAGHDVVVMWFDANLMVTNPDLILHPAAHGWHESMFESPYLKTALTAGRKRHRERKKNA